MSLLSNLFKSLVLAHQTNNNCTTNLSWYIIGQMSINDYPLNVFDASFMRNFPDSECFFTLCYNFFLFKIKSRIIPHYLIVPNAELWCEQNITRSLKFYLKSLDLLANRTISRYYITIKRMSKVSWEIGYCLICRITITFQPTSTPYFD